jgi:hypothetical protein
VVSTPSPLTMHGRWVVGGLLSQFWPMTDAGGEPETNQFVFQWFVNYNFGTGWALASAPLNTANWDAEDGQQWTVPLGIGISKTTVFNADAAAGHRKTIVERMRPFNPRVLESDLPADLERVLNQALQGVDR